MEYVKGRPFFCFNKTLIKSYPYLKKDIECDVLIIGGGIDGAIANFYLAQNHDVVLVDKGRFGYLCTSCATALLEYQLDAFANDLSTEMTNNDLTDVYNMGLYAINKIESFIKKYGNKCYFNKRPTLIFTNSILDENKIEQEYNFRKQNGFNCKIITPNNNPFSFELKKGLYCEDGGAELDPYLFTKQLIENAKNQKRIYENTEITKLVNTKDGVIAISHYSQQIKCKKVVLATGFNWELINKHNLCERTITYSIVTKPIKNFSWYNNTLLQDLNSPYHYLRLLPDNRIIIGGEDTKFNEKGIKEKVALKKYDKLYDYLLELFPSLQNKAEIDYSFCGSFGSTTNNLGLMEETENKNILYFISCGANGIINAMYAVEILDDILNNRKNKLENLFSPKKIL